MYCILKNNGVQNVKYLYLCNNIALNTYLNCKSSIEKNKIRVVSGGEVTLGLMILTWPKILLFLMGFRNYCRTADS